MLPISFPQELELFKSQLNVFLDEFGLPLGPLVHSFFKDAGDSYNYFGYKPQYQGVHANLLSWLLDHNIEYHQLMSLFDNMLARLKYLRINDHEQWISALEKVTHKHPQALQKLWEMHPQTMDPSYIMLVFTYSSDPLRVWDAHPEWQNTCDKFNNPVLLSQKTGNAYIRKNHILPVDSIKKLCTILPEETAKNILNAFMLQSIYNLHYTDAEGGGNTYHMGQTLKNMVFPAVQSGYGPSAMEWFTFVSKKYKGRKLVQDSLEGANWALDYAKKNGLYQVEEHCYYLFDAMLPLAIKEGLHAVSESRLIDSLVESLGAQGKLSTKTIGLWWNSRIPMFSLNHYSLKPKSWDVGKWSSEQKAQFVAKVYRYIKQKYTNEKNDAKSTLNISKKVLTTLNHRQLKNTFIEQMPASEWSVLTTDLLADQNLLIDLLINNSTPRISQLCTYPEVRIIVVSACLEYISKQLYPNSTTPLENNLINFITAKEDQEYYDAPLLSFKPLPDPLNTLANIFPQYKKNFQHAAIQWLQLKNNDIYSIIPILNQICSVLLSKDIDLVQAASIKESMCVQSREIIQAMLVTKENYELPSTLFDTDRIPSLDL